jgi:choline dehydrogenase-like flavoprotein
MSRLPDPIQQGLARGWQVLGGPHAELPACVDCDVAIVGSGAGAGITAELLTAAGLDVVIVEEGPLRSSRDFHQLESEAYPALYQDSASRKTADKAISILQGRCVGGSTTVNWTSSFRTPSATLQYWREHFALPALTDAAMLPWFVQVERRLCVGPWLAAPNDNNQRLRTGAARLGIAVEAIQRNVDGCWNLGSCGMGCPTNAKQSMLVTTIPTALDRGARLLVQTRVQRLQIEAGRVQALHCVPVALNGAARAATGPRIRARHVVVAGGAINSPALLLRSDAPDPHQRLGRRTFLHPVVVSAAVFDEPIEGWRGAPQSLYSDHFLQTDAIEGPIGYKLEAAPLHPVLAASTLPGYGDAQAALLRDFAHTQALLALLRDGFHPQSPGGRVGVVRPDGQHWQIHNLSVHDGSLFPTSIGANPQLSVYGLADQLATGLARRLSGRDVTLA